jgi:hypothetical protein
MSFLEEAQFLLEIYLELKKILFIQISQIEIQNLLKCLQKEIFCQKFKKLRTDGSKYFKVALMRTKKRL